MLLINVRTKCQSVLQKCLFNFPAVLLHLNQTSLLLSASFISSPWRSPAWSRRSSPWLASTSVSWSLRWSPWWSAAATWRTFRWSVTARWRRQEESCPRVTFSFHRWGTGENKNLIKLTTSSHMRLSAVVDKMSYLLLLMQIFVFDMQKKIKRVDTET